MQSSPQTFYSVLMASMRYKVYSVGISGTMDTLHDCRDQIYTKAHTFNTTATAANSVKIYPGQPVLLPLKSLDNLDHNVSLDTVYFAYTFEGNRSIAEVEPG